MHEFFRHKFTMIGGLVTLPTWVPLALWFVTIICVCLYVQMRMP